jgi:hypothetical protein
MLPVEFETTIPVFELAKIFHTLDRAPTVIGYVGLDYSYSGAQKLPVRNPTLGPFSNLFNSV